MNSGAVVAIRVLLIDDDQNYYTLTSRLLAHTHQDFELDWAATYDNGLEMLLRREHDVYLIDYLLGTHSGLELLQAGLDESISAPMILMTGHGEHNIDLRAIKGGAADYVDKTELKPDYLQRTIRYALERNRFTQALRTSEETYRGLLEDASDGIIIADHEGTMVLVNTRAHELLGHPDHTLVGRNLLDIIHDSDTVGDPLAGAISSGRTTLVERRLRRADGSPLDVEASARRVGNDQVQFIIRDITDRNAAKREREKYIDQLTILRQVDEELSQIVNIENVLSLALDAAVRLSGANAGFIGLMENGQLQMAQSIGHYSQTASGTLLKTSPLIQKLIDTQEPRLIQDVSQEPEYVAAHPDTKAQMMMPLISYERLIGVMNLETNKPERFTQEVFDFLGLIAARCAVAVENAQLYKIAQDQLAQLQDLYAQVSALEKIKTDMIRIAAHDLRNPVGVILGYTQLLERELEDVMNDKRIRYLQAVERAARRMEKITTDILSLERIENIQLHRAERLSLSALVEECFHELEAQAKAKKQKYRLSLPIKSTMVQGDGVQLGEAISNLIGNAIKYTPEGGTINVTLEQSDGSAVFKVKDTGYGIPENQQANLFRPFFRASTEETASIEGTGLGLHLVKNIVIRCDGEMIFSSVYGEGSTFGFKLPLS